MSEAPEGALGLSEFIHGLRAEIESALAEGRGSKVRFRPGPIDLELQVQAERKGGAKAGVEFKVFGTGANVGIDGGVTTGRHQTLKMRLEVVLDPEFDNLISGRSDNRNL